MRFVYLTITLILIDITYFREFTLFYKVTVNVDFKIMIRITNICKYFFISQNKEVYAIGDNSEDKICGSLKKKQIIKK